MRAALALALVLLTPLSTQAQTDLAPEAAGDASAAPGTETDGAASPATTNADALGVAASGAYVPPASAGAPGLYLGPAEADQAAAEAPRRGVDWAILGSGAGLLAGGWLLTWLATIVWYADTTSCSGSLWSGSYSCTHVGGPGGWGLGFSFAPVVGPWIMLADPYLDTSAEAAPPVLFGLVQDVGLILLIVGLIERRELPPATRAAGEWRIGGSAGPNSAFATVDVAF